MKNRNSDGRSCIAKLSSVHVSPRKLGLVAQVIRGMKVHDALLQLEFMKRRIAKTVHGCLFSALSNAMNNHGMDVDSLYVDEVLVGRAFVLKRSMPRAKGRGSRLEKTFSNLTISLKEQG